MTTTIRVIRRGATAAFTTAAVPTRRIRRIGRPIPAIVPRRVLPAAGELREPLQQQQPLRKHERQHRQQQQQLLQPFRQEPESVVFVQPAIADRVSGHTRQLPRADYLQGREPAACDDEPTTSRQRHAPGCRSCGPGDERYISGRANRSGKRDATADRATTADKCRPTTRRRGGSRLSENHRRACRRHGGHAATRRLAQWRRAQSGRRRSRCQRARPQQHEGGPAAIEQRARQRWRASVRRRASVQRRPWPKLRKQT